LFNLTPDQIAEGLTAYFVLLFSLSFHEAAHAWMALRMGDDTAHRAGRITLNPFPHIDPIGTVLLPMLQFLSGGRIPLFAWAKPTPVAGHNLRRLARGHILVAAAGPSSNLILAVFFTALAYVAFHAGLLHHQALRVILSSGISINVSLAVFNLLPIPPLDGSWIASWGLPRRMADRYDSVMEPYGFLILMALFITGALDWTVVPVSRTLQNLLISLVG
jgi:Zn-dependent protease